MGMDLVLAVLEFPRTGEPDFAAARARLAGMTNEEVLKAMDLNEQHDDPCNHCENDSLATLSVKEISPCISCTDGSRYRMEVARAEEARARIAESIDTVEDAWDGKLRLAAPVTLSRTIALIAGGASYGESPDHVEEFYLFCDAGLASVAGFLIDDPEEAVAA